MSDWIELTRKLGEGIPVYPGDPLFQSRPFAEHATDGFRASRWTFGSHVGTHWDAPFHYFVDGETLDSFPIDFFFGDAAVLDLTSTIAAAPRRAGSPPTIAADDLAPFEPIFEAVPFVLLRTGWSERIGRADYFNAFPSLTPEAADWLADFPKLRALGLETPSLVAFPTLPTAAESGDIVRFEPKKRAFVDEFLPDGPPRAADADADAPNEPQFADVDFDEPLDELQLCADAECHRILLGRRPPILILEGLVRLETLPAFFPPSKPGDRVAFDAARTVEIAAPPLFVERSDGGPARVAARWKERSR